MTIKIGDENLCSTDNVRSVRDKYDVWTQVERLSDKSDSMKLVTRYMTNVHVSAFLLLHESLDGEPFLVGQRDEWKRLC